MKNSRSSSATAALCVITLALLTAAVCPAYADCVLPDTQPSSLVRISDGTAISFEEVTSSEQFPLMDRSLPLIGVPAMRSSFPNITGAGQTVVVIDSGIDYTHPALSSRYVYGYDFGNNDTDPMDYNGHGTHVSGTIVSTDATYGGVAPGANIISLKVFADGASSTSDALVGQALNWVVANKDTYNITAVNMSLGDGEQAMQSSVNPLDPIEQSLATLKDNGVFVACASGNDGYLFGMNHWAVSPSTVSVGGVWANDDYSGYVVHWEDPYTYATPPEIAGQTVRMGDYAPVADDMMVAANRYQTPDEGLDLLAPAAMITSTVPIGLDVSDGEQDGFAAKIGTSMASPHVAGASMLVRQALEENGLLDPDPSKQVDQILAILQDTGVQLVDNFGEGQRNVVFLPPVPGEPNTFYPRPGTGATYSRIDLNAAISSVYGVPEPGTIGMLICAVLSGMMMLRRRSR